MVVKTGRAGVFEGSRDSVEAEEGGGRVGYLSHVGVAAPRRATCQMHVRCPFLSESLRLFSFSDDYLPYLHAISRGNLGRREEREEREGRKPNTLPQRFPKRLLPICSSPPSFFSFSCDR